MGLGSLALVESVVSLHGYMAIDELVSSTGVFRCMGKKQRCHSPLKPLLSCLQASLLQFDELAFFILSLVWIVQRSLLLHFSRIRMLLALLHGFKYVWVQNGVLRRHFSFKALVSSFDSVPTFFYCLRASGCRSFGNSVSVIVGLCCFLLLFFFSSMVTLALELKWIVLGLYDLVRLCLVDELLRRSYHLKALVVLISSRILHLFCSSSSHTFALAILDLAE